MPGTKTFESPLLELCETPVAVDPCVPVVPLPPLLPVAPAAVAVPVFAIDVDELEGGAVARAPT
jgi:hypothetical protein